MSLLGWLLGLNAQGLFVNSPTKSEQHLSWWSAALQTDPPILCPDEKAANELLEKLFSSLFSSASFLPLFGGRYFTRFGGPMF